jgi:hypothetical protein
MTEIVAKIIAFKMFLATLIVTSPLYGNFRLGPLSLASSYASPALAQQICHRCFQRDRRLRPLSPSMRRPVDVKAILFFTSADSLPLSRAAAVTILRSAVFVERLFARCKVGVLNSVGAAT